MPHPHSARRLLGDDGVWHTGVAGRRRLGRRADTAPRRRLGRPDALASHGPASSGPSPSENLTSYLSVVRLAR
jgi:hypothetical protein